jgi:hypothetical protein
MVTCVSWDRLRVSGIHVEKFACSLRVSSFAETLQNRTDEGYNADAYDTPKPLRLFETSVLKSSVDSSDLVYPGSRPNGAGWAG